MSYLTTIRQPAGDRETFLALANPDRAHKHVMSLFPDGMGAIDGARAAMGILFRVDFPPRLATGDVVLRVQSALQIDSTSEPIASVSSGETLMVAVRIAAITRSGSRERAVLDSASESWTRGMFAKSGMDTLDLQVSKSTFRGDRKGIGFPSRDVIARVGISDEKLANETILEGMGRGKSYGYGLVSFQKVGS